MAETARAQGAPAYGLGRLFRAVPVSPWWLGLALAAALVVLFLVSELALRRFDLVLSSAAVRGDFRIAIVLLCMLAYLPPAREAVLAGFRRNLEELRPVLECSDAAFEELRAAIGCHDRRLLRLFAGLGVLLGLGAPVLTNLSLNAYDFGNVVPEATWHRVATPLIGWLLASFVHVVVVESRRLSRIGREQVRVDLLDPGAFAPFARQGLRNALLATGFLGLAALLLLELEQAPGFAWLLAGLYLIVIAAAGAGLVLPVRGLHQRLRERKRAELAWCAAELRRARERLASGEGPPGPALADLAAWRGVVASASEWPFDTSTLTRFGLYLAIPLGSWLGGALVERVVDGLLG